VAEVLAVLAADVPPGLQVVGSTREGFRRAVVRGDPLAVSAVREGVILRGSGFFRGVARRRHP